MWQPSPIFSIKYKTLIYNIYFRRLPGSHEALPEKRGGEKGQTCKQSVTPRVAACRKEKRKTGNGERNKDRKTESGKQRERKTKIEKQEAKHEKETDIDIILVTNYHRVHERHRPIGSRYISVRALLPG